MTKPLLRPALITVEKERVQALDLTDVDGVLAIPADRGYRYIGDVFVDSTHKDGMRVRRWFATTLVNSNLGPFSNRQEALRALLDWNHLRSASVEETSLPLF